MPIGKKFGGRVKGTPNKKTLQCAELARKMGVDPFKILLQFAAGDWKGLGYEEKTRTYFTMQGLEIEEDIIKPDMRITASKEVAKYIHPQLKSVEVSPGDGDAFRLIIEDYTKQEK